VRRGRALLPPNPRELLKEAISLSFDWWIDEKGTLKNPGWAQRKPSDLSFEEAYQIINTQKPLWIASFRNHSALYEGEKDYWDIGGCNIQSEESGEVFLWIYVLPEEAEKLFQRWGIEVQWYDHETSEF